MIFNFFKLLLLALLLIACRKTTSSDQQLIKVGVKKCVQKTFGNERITICFDSVIQDSRCPINANCIWQGVAQAKFSAFIQNQKHVFTLSTNNVLPGTITDTTISNYTISFANLHPYPGQAGGEIYAEILVRY